jgi:hypothetical protein
MRQQNVNAADSIELTEIITSAELVATENWDGVMYSTPYVQLAECGWSQRQDTHVIV